MPERGDVVQFDTKGKAAVKLHFYTPIDSLAFAATGTPLAGLLFVGSMVFIAVVLVLRAMGTIALEGWMWAGLGFLVLWNIQFLCMAVLGEYIVRTHRHTQRRPLYVVETIIEGKKG